LIGLFLFTTSSKNENLKIFLKKKTTKNKIQDYQDTTSFDKRKINGVAGNFILDTGASNSCVGFESVDLFALEAKIKDKSSGSRSYWNVYTIGFKK
jgi:hypothetical protein